jgi:hypothetical protein
MCVVFAACIALLFGEFQGHRAKRQWETRVLADINLPVFGSFVMNPVLLPPSGLGIFGSTGRAGLFNFATSGVPASGFPFRSSLMELKSAASHTRWTSATVEDAGPP